MPQLLINEKIKFIDYVLVLTLLTITANPFFSLINVYVPFIFMLFVWAYAIYKGKLKNSKRFFQILIAVYFLIIIQFALFGGITPAGLYKPLLLFLTPYILYRLLGLRYFKCLFDIIYYSSIITFPIYLLQSLIPSVNTLITGAMEFMFQYGITDWPRSILFYSMPRESGFILLRNSGIFHEPGAYSIYLMLAIIINTFFTRNTLDRKNIVLTIILLTTFSTTGYVLLAIFFAYAIPKSRLHPLLKYFIFILMITLTIKTYRSANFLQEKIDNQFLTQVDAIQTKEKGQGRFYSFLMALDVIKQNHFIGKGIIEANRPVGEGVYFEFGAMGIFAQYGIIFGVFYLFVYYKGIRKLTLLYGLPRSLSLIFFIIIQLGLSSQAFNFHASFIMFFIIGLDAKVNLTASALSTVRVPINT